MRPASFPIRAPGASVAREGKPAVILATGNAAAIAARRPDAFVVDHVGIRVLHGSEQVVLGVQGRRTLLFHIATAALLAADGYVDHEDVWAGFYGPSVDGGPLHPMNVFFRCKGVLKPFFAWAGLQFRSRHGHHDFECLWLPERVSLARDLRLTFSRSAYTSRRDSADVVIRQAAA